MYKNYLVLSYITAFIFSITGCEQPLPKRHYTEVFIESESKSSLPMNRHHALLQMMPKDDIHANLNLDKMDMESMDDMGDMSVQKGLDQSADKTPLRWIAPEGWLERRGSGMRVATFKNADQQNPIEVTIVALGGNAGGIAANVVRWMQQINLETPDAVDLATFIKSQENLTTAAGLTATMVDLTEWQAKASSDTPSMIAAIIDRGSSQIFIKMTGDKKAVIQNRDAFKSLVQSIGVNE